MTVRHLLNHTSGIKSYTGVTAIDGLAAHPDHTPERILKMVPDKPLDSSRGDVGVQQHRLLPAGHGRREGPGGPPRPFARQLEERIFKPFGDDQDPAPNNPKAIIPGRSEGYGRDLRRRRHTATP